jgi:hypothetical protein
MLEHAADELLELQLLVLVLVAHVVHLRHHSRQVNLNQIEIYTIGPDQREVRETGSREGRQVVIPDCLGGGGRGTASKRRSLPSSNKIEELGGSCGGGGGVSSSSSFSAHVVLTHSQVIFA